MRSVNVLESTVLHASDQLFWLDGSTAENTSDMRRINGRISLSLTESPRDLSIREGAGKTVFWRQVQSSLIDGSPDEAEKTFTSPGTYTLAGVATDPTGRYLPRALSVNAGDSPPQGHMVTLYPTPVSVRFNSAGGLKLTLARDADDTPLPWAIITVIISIPGLGNQSYRAQSDQHGDVLLPFLRLPPLPEGVDDYNATLSVRGADAATSKQPENPDDFSPMKAGHPDNASFSESIGFSVVPGELSTLRSDGRNFLAIKPV